MTALLPSILLLWYSLCVDVTRISPFDSLLIIYSDLSDIQVKISKVKVRLVRIFMYSSLVVLFSFDYVFNTLHTRQFDFLFPFLTFLHNSSFILFLLVRLQSLVYIEQRHMQSSVIAMNTITHTLYVQSV